MRSLDITAEWNYGIDGLRHHYLVEARLGLEICGRAHGWFENGGRFVLEKIEIDPAERGRGYGSAVIELMRMKAREEQCSELVFKGVRTANEGAIRLYRALGAQGVPASDGLLDFVLSPP